MSLDHQIILHGAVFMIIGLAISDACTGSKFALSLCRGQQLVLPYSTVQAVMWNELHGKRRWRFYQSISYPLNMPANVPFYSFSAYSDKPVHFSVCSRVLISSQNRLHTQHNRDANPFAWSYTATRPVSFSSLAGAA